MALGKHHSLQCANKKITDLSKEVNSGRIMSFSLITQRVWSFQAFLRFQMAEMYVQVFSIKQLQVSKYNIVQLKEASVRKLSNFEPDSIFFLSS